MTRCAKIPYRKAGAARHAIRRLRDTGKVVGALSVYVCPSCGAWHIGHADGAGVARSVRVAAKIEAAVAEDRRKREGAG